MTEQHGRRAFLTKAGAAAGAAWVAPQVLSVPAVAAQSGIPVPTFLTCAGAHDINGDDLTITIGAGLDELDVQPGDFLVAIAANHIDFNHFSSPAAPAGWTFVAEVDSQDAGGPQQGVCTMVFTHVVAVGDTAYTFTLNPAPPASTAYSLLIVAFSGAASLDPAAPATATAVTGDTTITVGGITPSIPEVLTVALIGSENPEDPWAEPQGYTEVCNYAPHQSAPALYAATASFGTTSVPPATFTATGIGHPEAAYLLGLSSV